MMTPPVIAAVFIVETEVLDEPLIFQRTTELDYGIFGNGHVIYKLARHYRF